MRPIIAAGLACAVLLLAACSVPGRRASEPGLLVKNDTNRALSVNVDHGRLDPSTGAFTTLGSLLADERINRGRYTIVDLGAYENLLRSMPTGDTVLRVQAMDPSYRSTLTFAYLVPASTVGRESYQTNPSGGTSRMARTVVQHDHRRMSGRVRWEGYPNNYWLVTERGFAEVIASQQHVVIRSGSMRTIPGDRYPTATGR